MRHLAILSILIVAQTAAAAVTSVVVPPRREIGPPPPENYDPAPAIIIPELQRAFTLAEIRQPEPKPTPQPIPPPPEPEPEPQPAAGNFGSMKSMGFVTKSKAPRFMAVRMFARSP